MNPQMQLPIEIEQLPDNRNGGKAVGGGILGSHFNISFERVISLENLITAWYEFRRGKSKRIDVQQFANNLEDNIFALHNQLKNGLYKHDHYSQFNINDPKPRLISKATVKDRLVYHALYRALYPLFDKTFIYDSYSCRKNKGTHKAFQRLRKLILSCSQNYTQPCFALKCDIYRFFDSIDHNTLLSLIAKKVHDSKLLLLIKNIIDSFETSSSKGMPIGNLTSQLFANIYMDPLDKFIKHRLKAKHYLRYADDFLLLSNSPTVLHGYLKEINAFVQDRLKLKLHPHKISLRKLSWGIDFVGYVALPYQTKPRNKTVKRIFKKIEDNIYHENIDATFNSYLGYLQHADSEDLQLALLDRWKSVSHTGYGNRLLTDHRPFYR